MRHPRRSVSLVATTCLLLAACGGGSDDESEDSATTEAATVATDTVESIPTADDPEPEDPASEEPAAEEPAAEGPVDEAPEDEAPVDEEPSEAAPDDGAGVEAVAASLVEWAIDAPTEYAAGSITFSASNDGSFPHELVVVRGDGYASLPLADGGAVIEDDLPEGALVGRTARIGGGSTEDLVVDLEPGNYVLLCNLGGGGNSHAGQGQTLDIVVS